MLVVKAMPIACYDDVCVFRHSVRESSSMSRTWKVVIFVVGAAIVMRVLGLDLKDLYGIASARVARASADTGALFSGEYTERTAERFRSEAAGRIRAEAANLPPVVPGAGADDEMNRELAAERKRILKEKADNLERVVAHVGHGDVEGLKRQVAENARRAGGDQ
jgi:hypothetical protein